MSDTLHGTPDGISQEILLVLNTGSSSIKFGLYHQDEPNAVPTLDLTGAVTSLGRNPELAASDGEGRTLEGPDFSDLADDREALLDRLIGWLKEQAEQRGGLSAVGHRVVHGGLDYEGPVVVDATVLERLKGLAPLAPLHQPHNLQPVTRLREAFPNLLQVACFDTAFHRTQPPVATWFALPGEYRDEGVLRYGFHGLSYEYIARVLPQYDSTAAQGRTVVAHLGHGASLCALQEGRSIATTMGFTALDGLPMGRRCGSLDPGVVLYLIGEKGLSSQAVENLLYKESGLYGVSGFSDDMRELLESDLPAAREAVELFVYRAVRETGSLVAALGGLDALVFTGGMGERAAPIRKGICDGLGAFGVRLEGDANERHKKRISDGQSRVSVWVIPTDEELMIAQHTLTLCNQSGMGVHEPSP